MSKELIERIMDYTSRHRRTAPQVCDILTACKQRIEEMQSDINGWLVIKGNMTKHQQELEQENSRLKGRVEAEAQSGMQSLRTQENLFGAKLDALQAQLEAASGYLGRLLTTVWPQIELCPDLMGICTQIDHLLASLRDNRVKEDKEKV